LEAFIRAALPNELSTLLEIDNEACSLFVTFGMNFELSHSHPFVVAETQRWSRAISEGRCVVAVAPSQNVLGFAVLGQMDGLPFLDQVAVRPSAARRGLGRDLVRHAVTRNAAYPLWLTTYLHVPWNAPFYERLGFAPVADASCGPELLARLVSEREVLPSPEQRTAMVRRAS
jgi:GNAT superfamily N-acetyltransferase